jgi:uncharacterized protein YjaZ
MKCYYIVIAYLPGYSVIRRFLNALKAPDARSMNIQTEKLLEIVVDYNAII